jgi:hypothetical protein
MRSCGCRRVSATAQMTVRAGKLCLALNDVPFLLFSAYCAASRRLLFIKVTFCEVMLCLCCSYVISICNKMVLCTDSRLRYSWRFYRPIISDYFTRSSIGLPLLPTHTHEHAPLYTVQPHEFRCTFFPVDALCIGRASGASTPKRSQTMPLCVGQPAR